VLVLFQVAFSMADVSRHIICRTKKQRRTRRSSALSFIKIIKTSLGFFTQRKLYMYLNKAGQYWLLCTRCLCFEGCEVVSTPNLLFSTYPEVIIIEQIFSNI
jgi:hypothetical protein